MSRGAQESAQQQCEAISHWLRHTTTVSLHLSRSKWGFKMACTL